MKSFTVTYRVVTPFQEMKRGDYFQTVQALNFIHAIDKVRHSFGEFIHDAVIEVVVHNVFGTQARVVYDREFLAL